MSEQRPLGDVRQFVILEDELEVIQLWTELSKRDQGVVSRMIAAEVADFGFYFEMPQVRPC